jgi:hypothetical protein
MTKKAQAVQPKRIITASPNDPIMKLVKQVGIEDIASDVINAIISPLIGLIAAHSIPLSRLFLLRSLRISLNLYWQHNWP